jgi:hypothetical protein
MSPFTITRRGNYLKIHHPQVEHPFTISGGNTKVQVPIVTFYSSLTCVNASWCPYSIKNPDRDVLGVKCYAQKLEKLRTNVRVARERNGVFVIAMKELGLIHDFGERLALEIWFAWRSPYVRYNEGADLDSKSVSVLITMQKMFDSMVEMDSRIFPTHPPKLYGYSKSSPVLIEQLRSNGISVMDSDRQFVIVDDTTKIVTTPLIGVVVSHRDDLKIFGKTKDIKGATVCTGVCGIGSCTACMEPTEDTLIVVGKH